MEKKLYEKIRKTNAAAGKLRLRIEKLEKENGELTEKMKQLKADKDEERERNWNSQMEKVKYEIEAIVIENEEKTRTAIEAISSKIEHIREMVESQKESHDQVLKEATTLEEIQAIPKEKETILLLGGGNGSIDSYDMTMLEENRWSELALKLPKRPQDGGAVFLDGEIYIFGGYEMEKELFKLDNKTLKWIRLADMNEGRRWISNSSVEWNGSIWVFGGWNGSSYLKSVVRYDPKEDKWTKMPGMKYLRRDAAAAVHNGKFIVCGGWVSNYLKSVECFDPESGVWTELNDMPTPLACHSLVSYGNNLILMGGFHGKTIFNTVLELSNLEGKGTWKELPPMKQRRYRFSTAVLDNEIFVIGGWNDKFLCKTEIFNGNSWREGPQLPNMCLNRSPIVIPRHLADILYNYTE